MTGIVFHVWRVHARVLHLAARVGRAWRAVAASYTSLRARAARAGRVVAARAALLLRARADQVRRAATSPNDLLGRGRDGVQQSLALPHVVARCCRRGGACVHDLGALFRELEHGSIQLRAVHEQVGRALVRAQGPYGPQRVGRFPARRQAEVQDAAR